MTGIEDPARPADPWPADRSGRLGRANTSMYRQLSVRVDTPPLDGASRLRQVGDAADAFLVAMEETGRPGSAEVVLGAKKRWLGKAPTWMGCGWLVAHVRHPDGGSRQTPPLYLIETGEWVGEDWVSGVPIDALLIENADSILSGLAWLMEFHGVAASRDDEDRGEPPPIHGTSGLVGPAADPGSVPVDIAVPELAGEASLSLQPSLKAPPGANHAGLETADGEVPEAADDAWRAASAVLIARLAVGYGDELYPMHTSALLALAVNKLIEASRRTPYRSQAAATAQTGRRLVPHHVVPLAALREQILLHPDGAEAILGTAAVCLVTIEERQRLTDIHAQQPDLLGWELYAAAGIEVRDGEGGEVGVEALASSLCRAWAAATA